MNKIKINYLKVDGIRIDLDLLDRLGWIDLDLLEKIEFPYWRV